MSGKILNILSSIFESNEIFRCFFFKDNKEKHNILYELLYELFYKYFWKKKHVSHTYTYIYTLQKIFVKEKKLSNPIAIPIQRIH